MNLIERLGGYEKAKQVLISCEFHGRKDLRVPVAGGFIHIVVDFLEKDLLDYRKENNIFEVGDKVIFTDVLNSCLVTFESIESNPMQIVWLTYPDGTAGYVFHLSKIRHASDEEIKAGHRL